MSRNLKHSSPCSARSLPTRKTLSENLLPKMYEKEVEKAKTKLQAGQAVCLTTDGWTSDNNDSFIAVTAHYIADSKLESTMLGCVEYAERHTAANLAEFLKKVTQDWDIEHRVTAVASDNAANVTTAIKTAGWRKVPCFAHTLNLCVQTALAAISTTTSRVKNVVEYFKRSSHAQAKLLDMQRQLGVPLLKLKQDVVTRWNSTYDMFRRIILVKSAVAATLAVLRPDLILHNSDWQIIEMAVPILKIFSDVTIEISAEKNVTLSKVIPLCSILIVNAKQLLDAEQPVLEVSMMVEILLGELERRFHHIENSELHAEAALLDPRFKDVRFRDKALAERAINNLKMKVGRQRPPPNASTCQLDSANQPSTSAQKSTPSSLWEQFDLKVKKLVPTNPTAAGIVEFEKYMQEPMLSRTSEPFAWWHERRVVYPRLYNFMLKRLNLVATSVPCERIFSKAGNILTERRRRLTSKKVSQLLFISCNI
ncbi:E3 SUMO-protein ligase ZBED1-like [Choristoneura fumiferana]|uniref:E3 SUMO-protein ligase ZBED1-like n=1 Tax=Choristoneura fumiferana TaxID=7141 RepID=UPI003D1599C8